MAKKKDNKNKEEIKEFEVTNCDLQKDAPVEVVAKCNHPEEVVANCDHLQYHYECFRSYASFYGSECRHLNEDSSSGKTSDRNRPKDSANLSKNINFCAISFGN